MDLQVRFGLQFWGGNKNLRGRKQQSVSSPQNHGTEIKYVYIHTPNKPYIMQVLET